MCVKMHHMAWACVGTDYLTRAAWIFIWTSIVQLAITACSFDDHLPEVDHFRPKHVVGMSYIYELLSPHCCAVVWISIVS